MARTMRLPADPAFAGTVAGTDTAKLREELAAALDRRRALNAERTEAERERNSAPNRDAAAYATARRSGAPDPGPVATRAAEQHIADVLRKSAGEAQTIASIERDLAALRDEREGVWLQDLAAQETEARLAATALYDQLAAAVANVERLAALAKWVRGSKPHATSPATMLDSGVRNRPHPLSRTLAAVGATLREWEPSAALEDAEDDEE